MVTVNMFPRSEGYVALAHENTGAASLTIRAVERQHVYDEVNLYGTRDDLLRLLDEARAAVEAVEEVPR